MRGIGATGPGKSVRDGSRSGDQDDFLILWWSASGTEALESGGL